MWFLRQGLFDVISRPLPLLATVDFARRGDLTQGQPSYRAEIDGVAAGKSCPNRNDGYWVENQVILERFCAKYRKAVVIIGNTKRPQR